MWNRRKLKGQNLPKMWRTYYQQKNGCLIFFIFIFIFIFGIIIFGVLLNPSNTEHVKTSLMDKNPIDIMLEAARIDANKSENNSIESKKRWLREERGIALQEGGGR